MKFSESVFHLKIFTVNCKISIDIQKQHLKTNKQGGFSLCFKCICASVSKKNVILEAGNSRFCLCMHITTHIYAYIVNVIQTNAERKKTLLKS